jgi:hypothetical protein
MRMMLVDSTFSARLPRNASGASTIVLLPIRDPMKKIP